MNIAKEFQARALDLATLAGSDEPLLRRLVHGDLSESFQRMLDGAMVLAGQLVSRRAEQVNIDARQAWRSAEREAMAAVFVQFMFQNPDVVDQVAAEQQELAADLEDVVTRLQKGIHFDNPQCVSCGGDSRVIDVQNTLNLVKYQCLCCDRLFTNRAL